VVEWDGFLISIYLSDVVKINGGFYIYGGIEIKSKKYILSADLRCFKISVGGLVSKDIHFDSRYLDLQARDFKATNGLIKAPVYWGFLKEISVQDIKNINIIVDNDVVKNNELIKSSCVQVQIK